VFDVGIRMLAYSRDGTRIVTAEGKDGARLWDAADPGVVMAYTQGKHGVLHVLGSPMYVFLSKAQSRAAAVLGAAFAPDGTRVLTADGGGHLKLWNTQSGALENDIALATTAIPSAAFDPTGNLVAAGDAAGVLHLLSLQSGLIEREVTTTAGAIVFVSFSADGTRLVTAHSGAGGDSVMIWDPATWKAQVEDGYGAAAFSPDGKILALGGRDVQLLDAATGKTLRTVALRELDASEAGLSDAPQRSKRKLAVMIRALAWAPDGQRLAAGCLDGTVRLIPVAQVGR
jgi:WD40 repeat protein